MARGLELRQAVAAHYLLGGAPITFVQHFLGHENLATTGIYTQLVDGMAKKIALETETALEGMEDEDEGLMKRREAQDMRRKKTNGIALFAGL